MPPSRCCSVSPFISASTVSPICSVMSRLVFQAKYPSRNTAKTANTARKTKVSLKVVVRNTRTSLPAARRRTSALAVTDHISGAAHGMQQGTRKHLDTGEELGERIRFGEIVVAAGAQALDPVVDLPER